MLRVSHLKKNYGNYEAVKDLSFVLERGKIYALLGQNGAGKSTTMNMITGYLPPTAGQIIIDGHDMAAEPLAAKRCIGYLPEIPPLYTDLTVAEYLRSVAQLKKIPADSQKREILDVMEQVEIADRQRFLIRNLSKGYRQRVGIAQALLGNPPLIILDEPMVGLDPKQVQQIRELIVGLKEKHTVIFSSHILTEVSQICDNILILHHGELAAEGSPGELDQLISARQTFKLTAEGERETLLSLVRETGNLTVTEMTPSGEDPVLRSDGQDLSREQRWDMTLTAMSAEDPRRKLFFAFANAQCPIIEMRREVHSLEEIFLSLTEAASENTAR